MAQLLNKNDIVLGKDASRLLSLVSDTATVEESITLVDGETRIGRSFDLSPAALDKALDRLKENQDLAARFHMLVCEPGGGRGRILWNGDFAGNTIGTQTMGVRLTNSRDGVKWGGDNLFGEFLETLRPAFLQYVSSSAIAENPIPEGTVITDFTRKGEIDSEITLREREGEEFIHVDPYESPWRRNMFSKDGTTGRGARESDSGVEFQTFVCPFGISNKSRIPVSTEAEASYYYEKALRGELDWKALFDDLRNRGLVSARTGSAELEKTIRRYDNQFKWMREQIAKDPDSLKDIPIVASSALVRDNSMGRSMFDAKYAPSPAHVLARYIYNPALLFSNSENSVARALSLSDHGEELGLKVSESPEGRPVNILVIGSDTIGGRIPGRKASKVYEHVSSVDKDGKRTRGVRESMVIPQKTDAEKSEDYENFKARMLEILGGIPETVPVRFITGSSSTMGDGVGLGTPRMVERFVKESNGQVNGWDFSSHSFLDRAVSSVKKSKAEKDKPSRLSVVSMDHFADCLPVLAGYDKKVVFTHDTGSSKDGEVEFTFSNKDFGVCDAALCFTADGDTYGRNVMSMASYAAMRMPVVHVQNVQSEEEQLESLRGGAVLSSAVFSGVDEGFGETLFGGPIRKEWEVGPSSSDYSTVLYGHDVVLPSVLDRLDTPVSVDGVQFRTVYGVYSALALKHNGEVENKEPKAVRSELISLSDNEAALFSIFGKVSGENAGMDLEFALKVFLDGCPRLSEVAEERLMRQAVRIVSVSNAQFSNRLEAMAGGDVVCRSTVPAGRLFTDVDGYGENRFGVVLAVEGRRIVSIKEEREKREAKEAAESEKEAAQRRAIYLGRSPKGEKVEGGLPRNGKEAQDAVWFLGTNTPDALVLPDEKASFVIWDEANGKDRLTRDKAGAPELDDGEGGRVANDLVFLFPSTSKAVMGRETYNVLPDSKDLTNVKRVVPGTGAKVNVAFGIPVKKNRGFVEATESKYSSYRGDNEVVSFRDDLVVTDALARTTAIRNGMSLSMVGKFRSDGGIAFPVKREFAESIYDYKKGKAVDNPHKSPLNEKMLDRYLNILLAGENYPLNCIPLPRQSYLPEDRQVLGGADAQGLDGDFKAEFNLALKIAKSTAVGLGVPLRFPLTPDGRIDFGPGLTEEQRIYAEQTVDREIGVVNEQELDGALPVIEVLKDAMLNLPTTGAVVNMHPRDLAAAFGPFESDEMLKYNTQRMYLHGMDLVMYDKDGMEHVFSLRDVKSTKGMGEDEINRVIRYEFNPLSTFKIKSDSPELVDSFKAALEGYVRRAREISVEWRLLDGDSKEVDDDMSLDGFVNLQPSYEYANETLGEHSIGVALDMTDKKVREAMDHDRNADQEYAGSVRATDGFDGYVQYRYTLPGSEPSDWKTLTDKDLELAKDIVMTEMRRSYPWASGRVVPEKDVLFMQLRALAVADAGEAFRNMDYKPAFRKKADDKVVSIQRYEEPVAARPSEDVGEGRSHSAKDIVYTVSGRGYAERTRENALADDVDFTLAFAVDFSTAGERCTAEAAGDSLFRIPLSVAKEGSLDISAEAVKGAVDSILEGLPDEYLKGQEIGFNIAGNGMQTLSKYGIRQGDCDVFLTKVLSSLEEKLNIVAVRSGGQTGIDEAGVAAAVALGLPARVHGPSGWAFRGSDGKDLRDESAYKARFENKDYEFLRDCACSPELSMKSQRQEPAVSFGVPLK